MKRCIVAIPASHAWLWPQVCLTSLQRYPPKADGVKTEIVVVDNSWDWSPSRKGYTETSLSQGITVLDNYKANRFHASALDCVIERYEFDYLMALETDVLALRGDWLQWFVSQMRDTDFAVGHWHHEQFINPSCTLYRGDVLRACNEWTKANPSEEQRWGHNFDQSQPMDPGCVDWVNGPFAEKRGWPHGTSLKTTPTGQMKGPGWYEPGQTLHHWAVDAGYDFRVCETATTFRQNPGLPTQTLYGTTQVVEDYPPGELWGKAYSVHLWGGTRALDIIKHTIENDTVAQNNGPWWQEREARFWRAIVPDDVQAQTLGLIRQYGFHTKGQGTAEVTDRDRAAAEYVKDNYRRGGVEW